MSSQKDVADVQTSLSWDQQANEGLTLIDRFCMAD